MVCYDKLFCVFFPKNCGICFNVTDSDCVRYFWALVKSKRKFINCVKFAENILDAMSRTQSPKRAPLEEDYVGKNLWFESSNVISTSQLTTTPQW